LLEVERLHGKQYNLYYQFDQGERTETQRRSGPGAPRT